MDAGSLEDPNYVKAEAVLDDIEMFDASFFGYTPREASLIDPQHRLFLEHAWEALEDAGYAAGERQNRIGVYAGESLNSYLISNLCPNRESMESAGGFQVIMEQRPRLSGHAHCLQAESDGPGAERADGLLNFARRCAFGLPEFVESRVRHGSGRRRDGRRAARPGRVSSGGRHHLPGWPLPRFRRSCAGNCQRKRRRHRRLEATWRKRLRDGYKFHAIIKGTAINNDGSLKVGFAAPSIEGQASVIEAALALAEVDPETITYVETHGTGTSLGDPIEVAALTQAFRTQTNAKNYCAIGSVKTNIGHTGGSRRCRRLD